MQGQESQVQGQMFIDFAIISRLQKLRISKNFIQSHTQRFLKALKYLTCLTITSFNMQETLHNQNFKRDLKLVVFKFPNIKYRFINTVKPHLKSNTHKVKDL